MEARRGRGVFVASAPPARPSPHLRARFLHETVIRAAALGMTADDPGGRCPERGAASDPLRRRGSVEVLPRRVQPAGARLFAGQLEGYLPIRVDKVLLGELAAAVRRHKQSRTLEGGGDELLSPPRGRAAPQRPGCPGDRAPAPRRISRPSTTRPSCRRARAVGVASAAVETAHNLEHSIAERRSCPTSCWSGRARPRVQPWAACSGRVDVMVCSTSAAERVRQLAAPSVHVLIDDRALDPRAIEMLSAILVRQNGVRPVAARS